MSNFPYNNTAEQVLAEEVGIVTEQNRKSGQVLMYFAALKMLLIGSLLALALWGQDLDTDTKVNIMGGVVLVGLAAAIIGPLVIMVGVPSQRWSPPSCSPRWLPHWQASSFDHIASASSRLLRESTGRTRV